MAAEPAVVTTACPVLRDLFEQLYLKLDEKLEICRSKEISAKVLALAGGEAWDWEEEALIEALQVQCDELLPELEEEKAIEGASCPRALLYMQISFSRHKVRLFPQKMPRSSTMRERCISRRCRKTDRALISTSPADMAQKEEKEKEEKKKKEQEKKEKVRGERLPIFLSSCR